MVTVCGPLLVHMKSIVKNLDFLLWTLFESKTIRKVNMSVVGINKDTHREQYKTLKTVKLDLKDLFEESNLILKWVDIFFDRVILARCEFTGYYNQISANRRLMSSAILTFWLFLVFGLITSILIAL